MILKVFPNQFYDSIAKAWDIKSFYPIQGIEMWKGKRKRRKKFNLEGQKQMKQSVLSKGTNEKEMLIMEQIKENWSKDFNAQKTDKWKGLSFTDCSVFFSDQFSPAG